MGIGSPSAEAGFAAVDDATDPISLVHYLDRMSGQLDEVKRRIRQQLEVGEGEFVLDVGCGTGDDARRLSALVGPSGSSGST
jgi:ubiquinone/menaquinone biosynthesis C-methylase UbiE